MKKFPLISGHISIDLINTEVVSHHKRKDKFTNNDDLIEWLDEIKGYEPFIDDQFISKLNESPTLANKVLKKLILTREFIRESYENKINGKEVDDELIKFAEKQMADNPISLRIIDGILRPFPAKSLENSIATLVSFDILKLYETNEMRFLKSCSNPECIVLFLDTTGRRRWCSMQICGNRSKSDRFREKNHPKIE